MNFRKARKEEIDGILSLIQERISWMDQAGIKQWNQTHYLERYPRSYFEENLDRLYVLCDGKDILLAVAMLYEHDDRWQEDGESAYYVHHFASSLSSKGVGKRFLLSVEDLAEKEGKKYLRLDSAIGNAKLEKYYTDLGYVPVGTCLDGPYEGILRQKKIH